MDRRREVLVGLVVVLGIVAGVFGSIWLKGGWQRGQTELRTAATSVGVLVPGAVVKFRGVTVGRVESIEVLPSGEAVMVEMKVLPELVIPENAAVLLAPESVFGEWQAEILDRSEFGLPPFLDYPEEGVLPGAALPDFSRLTATADQIARNLTVISERFEVAFNEETAQNLKNMIDNMGVLSEGLAEIIAQQTERFEQLAEGVDASAQELGAAARAARISFEHFDSLLLGAEAETMVADAGASLRNLREVTEVAGSSLGDLRAAAQKADSIFARMDGLLTMLETPDGSFSRLLGDPALADGAVGTLAEFRALLADIQENPRRYLSFSIF